jgi:hypothetical protein
MTICGEQTPTEARTKPRHSCWSDLQARPGVYSGGMAFTTIGLGIWVSGNGLIRRIAGTPRILSSFIERLAHWVTYDCRTLRAAVLTRHYRLRPHIPQALARAWHSHLYKYQCRRLWNHWTGNSAQSELFFRLLLKNTVRWVHPSVYPSFWTAPHGAHQSKLNQEIHRSMICYNERA